MSEQAVELPLLVQGLHEMPGDTTTVALTLPEDLTREEWEEVGLRLARIGRQVQFWIGDWLAYGTARFGSEVLNSLGWAEHTFDNWATVCRKVSPENRRSDVSFSVHAEVAVVPRKEQTKILDEAAREGWTVERTRQRVKALGYGRRKPRSTHVPRRSRQGLSDATALDGMFDAAVPDVTTVGFGLPPDRTSCDRCGAAVSSLPKLPDTLHDYGLTEVHLHDQAGLDGRTIDALMKGLAVNRTTALRVVELVRGVIGQRKGRG